MEYPTFVEIEPQHKNIIDSITCEFPPYCDVQFSNLLSWSLHKHPTRFSLLDGNLLVEMKEYDTEHIITMFIGKHNAPEALKKVLEKRSVVERVPEEMFLDIINSPLRDYFSIEEDSTNNDNVLDLNKIIALSGNTLKSKRRSVHTFQRLYPNHQIVMIEPDYSKTMPVFECFFKEIAEEQGRNFDSLADELEAVGTLLKYQELFTLPIIGVTYGDKMIGFTINEILHNSPHQTALGCFGKGIRKYKGIFA